MKRAIPILSTMADWLNWIDHLHQQEMALGLSRVQSVALRLQVLTFLSPVIVVGGTNGKGSTVAGLDAIYRAAGLNVGTFTSPFLFKHNEYIHLNGEAVSDAVLCQAFAKVETAREDVALTAFEYYTLAALVIFKDHALDVIILEVGLGGRLDAVNIIDADLAIVTSIDIDHSAILGDTRDKIAYEKAGIFRAQGLAIYGDDSPPTSLLTVAKTFNTQLYCQTKDFTYVEEEDSWSWQSQSIHYHNLPKNQLSLQNMAIVLMAISLLQEKIPVSLATIKKGLSEIKLLGRIQVINGPVQTILDVSHNPAAVDYLRKYLASTPAQGKTYAIFSMYADKDIAACIRVIKKEIHKWYCAKMGLARGATLDCLKQAFRENEVTEVCYTTTLVEAYQACLANISDQDRLVVFGSFRTVAEVAQSFLGKT